MAKNTSTTTKNNKVSTKQVVAKASKKILKPKASAKPTKR
jgi:hypothetical protein